MPQSRTAVTCPSCHAPLRSQRVIPAGANLRCPSCRSSFTAPAAPTSADPWWPSGPPPVPCPRQDDRRPDRETTTRSSLLTGAPFLVAVAAALALGVSSLMAVILFIALRPGASPSLPPGHAVGESRPENPEEEKKGAQAELEKKLAAQAKLDEEQAKRSRDQESARRRAAEEADKRKKEVERVLAAAGELMKEKRYEAAIRELETAWLLDVGNKEVRNALAEARSGRDDALAAKKRADDYEAHLDAARAALKAEQFVDAIREAQAALKLIPDDVKAAQLVEAAQAKLEDVADVKKRQAAFDRFLDQARDALKATRFNDATQAVNAALRLFQADREAKRLANDVKAALDRAKADNANLRARAKAQRQGGNLRQARQLYAKAVMNWAEDVAAQRALRQVDQLLADAAAEEGLRQFDQVNGDDAGDDQAAHRAAYVRAVREGQAAVLAENWAVAVIAYARAVELVRNDLVSAGELERARKELKRQKERQAEYVRQMADGNRLYGELMRKPTQQLKDDTIRAFQTALQEKPGDQVAEGKLRAAERVRIPNDTPENPPPPPPPPLKDKDKGPKKDKDEKKDKDKGPRKDRGKDPPPPPPKDMGPAKDKDRAPKDMGPAKDKDRAPKDKEKPSPPPPPPPPPKDKDKGTKKDKAK